MKRIVLIALAVVLSANTAFAGGFWKTVGAGLTAIAIYDVATGGRGIGTTYNRPFYMNGPYYEPQVVYVQPAVQYVQPAVQYVQPVEVTAMQRQAEIERFNRAANAVDTEAAIAMSRIHAADSAVQNTANAAMASIATTTANANKSIAEVTAASIRQITVDPETGKRKMKKIKKAVRNPKSIPKDNSMTYNEVGAK